MVVAEEVERGVNDEESELVEERPGVGEWGGAGLVEARFVVARIDVARGRVDADDDVAQWQCWRDFGGLAFAHGEREHVGWGVDAAPSFVEFVDFVVGGQDDAHFAVCLPDVCIEALDAVVEVGEWEVDVGGIVDGMSAADFGAYRMFFVVGGVICR